MASMDAAGFKTNYLEEYTNWWNNNNEEIPHSDDRLYMPGHRPYQQCRQHHRRSLNQLPKASVYHIAERLSGKSPREAVKYAMALYPIKMKKEAPFKGSRSEISARIERDGAATS